MECLPRGVYLGMSAGGVQPPPQKKMVTAVGGPLPTGMHTCGGSRISGGRQPIILPKFPENCMIIKKIGSRGEGCASKIFLQRSAHVSTFSVLSIIRLEIALTENKGIKVHLYLSLLMTIRSELGCSEKFKHLLSTVGAVIL